MLCNPKTRAKAFAIRIDKVQEPTDLVDAGAGHSCLSSWFQSAAPHLDLSTCVAQAQFALIGN